MKRRDFLKFIGVGGVGTGLGIFFGKLSQPPGAKLIPYLVPPEDIIPGMSTWYASLCTQCGAGCGTHVKVMEGRVKKIEGNPIHPVNNGGLCARGQAAPQALYNPDRIETPLRLTGARGSGSYEKISWDEAISLLGDNLKKLSASGETNGLYLVTGPVKGHLGKLLSGFMSAYGSRNYHNYELFGNRDLEYAARVSMGAEAIPHYDIKNTKYLLSFGADFSSTWLSPVNLSHGYGQMRQGTPGKRGKLVQVEPRMSLTGANADEWIPARPGTEGLLALAVSHAIVKKGYYRGTDAAAWRAVLAKYSPKEAAKVTEVKEERIYGIAKEFARTRASLAIGGDTLSGYSNGVSGLVAINVLNHLGGNIGAAGGLKPNAAAALGARKTKFGLSSLNSKKIKTLLLYNTNPVFTAPPKADIEAAIGRVPFTASFSSFMDETTAMADLILPAHTSLEDWGDDMPEPGVRAGVATIMQPAVTPMYDTKGLGDIFLSLSRVVGGKPADRFNDFSFQDYLRSSWKTLYSRDKEMARSAVNFDTFWNKLLKDGGWFPKHSKAAKPLKVSPRKVESHISGESAKFDGARGSYPLYLVLYQHNGFSDGRGANLPWLQETPDPMTSVVWGTWVEMNPATANSMGIKEGDLVSISSPNGKIEAPVYLYAGIRLDTVAIPVGQGHSSYGRYAKNRGANPLKLLPFEENKRTRSVAVNSTRVKVARISAKGGLVKTEATTNEYGREIIQTVTPAEYKKLAKHGGAGGGNGAEGAGGGHH